ncbi:MAG: YafY family transcriptional regulator [Sedimentisphaerales bacterium]|nr:YafY family transcriptional regulator [Sedimentisphaerales bacterium]
MKVSKITRVMKILTALQSGRKYSADELAETFGTSRRTVFRDMNELEAIGIPYHYDPKEQGYTIDPEFFLPPIDLNLQEALALLMLVHKARNQIQLPFKHSALLAGLKIENNLPVKIRQYCNTAMKYISTYPNAQAPLGTLDKLFAQLQKAITNKIKVTLLYHSLYDNKDLDVRLCPYHLLYNQRAWYVLGYSETYKSIRTFKLNRIKELELTSQRFIDGDDFDLHEYFGRAWSMIPEGRLYDIKLRFLPKVAQNVAEVQWHSTQHADWQDDGSVILQFRVDGINEISWWVLGYGDQVQILAPKALRKKIVTAAKKIIELNEKI